MGEFPGDKSGRGPWTNKGYLDFIPSTVDLCREDNANYSPFVITFSAVSSVFQFQKAAKLSYDNVSSIEIIVYTPVC